MTAITRSADSAFDDDLRARFQDLRRADAGAAPTIDELIARPGGRGRGAFAIPAALAAAAMLAAAGMRGGAPDNAHGAAALAEVRAASILDWQSPTAPLLRTPELTLLREIPTLRSSLLQDLPPDSFTRF